MHRDLWYLDCGFADPYYFRRLFHKCRGMTPREFRAHKGVSGFA